MAITGRTGWIIAASVFAVAIIGVAYIAISVTREIGSSFKDTFRLPEDLEAYESESSVDDMLTSVKSIDADTIAADSTAILLYIASLDSSGVGARAARDANKAFADGSQGRPIVKTITDAVKSEIRLEAMTRRAMVYFLNEHHISKPVYRWMKLRTIAAAGITREEADSAISVARIDASTVSSRDTTADGVTTIDALFESIDAVRESVTSDEARVAIAYRSRILDSAIPDLERLYPYFE